MCSVYRMGYGVHNHNMWSGLAKLLAESLSAKGWLLRCVLMPAEIQQCGDRARTNKAGSNVAEISSRGLDYSRRSVVLVCPPGDTPTKARTWQWAHRENGQLALDLRKRVPMAALDFREMHAHTAMRRRQTRKDKKKKNHTSHRNTR